MRPTILACALLAAALAPAAPAFADNPLDPDMQTPQALARDRELIRQLNLDLLAQIQERDREYAKSWREYELIKQGMHPEQLAYKASLADYQTRLAEYEANRVRFADNQLQYQSAMAAWREDVAACHAGDRAACAGR